MKDVIERIFERIQSSSEEKLDKMKIEVLTAAEEGLEAIQRYFEAAGQTLVQDSEKLANELNSKLRI